MNNNTNYSEFCNRFNNLVNSSNKEEFVRALNQISGNADGVIQWLKENQHFLTRYDLGAIGDIKDRLIEYCNLDQTHIANIATVANDLFLSRIPIGQRSVKNKRKANTKALRDRTARGSSAPDSRRKWEQPAANVTEERPDVKEGCRTILI